MTSVDRHSPIPRSLRAVPFGVVLAVVLYLGLRSEPVPEAFENQDKVHHALAFAALMFTLRLAFPRGRLVGLIAGSLIAALLIELGQTFQPHRSPSVADFLASSFGVLLGWISWVVMQGWLRPRTDRSSALTR